MSTAADAPRGLWNRGFLSLLLTQFFEAASDNIIKGVITFAVAVGGPWEHIFGEGGNGVIGILFTLPFVLFSAFGGRIADRASKSRITVVLKTISLAVCALCALEFARGSAWGAIAALLAFATVSAFFGPVKYGMIAELVAGEKLARANGIINMATNVAVILGTLVAGLAARDWKESFVDGAPTGADAWHPGMAMAVFVVLGFLTCLTLPRLRPQNPGLPVDLNPFSTYVSTLRLMARSPLLAVCAAWTFFYFVAAVVLLILPDYSSYLSIKDDETALLMAGLGVAIGVGCVLAAYLDTPARRSRFVPLGALGLAVAFGLLGVSPASFAITMAWLVLTGLVAGFYIIPLQSMLQSLSGDEIRGRVLGTANGVSFVMGAVGSGLFFLLRQLGMPSNRVFLVLAALCLAMAWVSSRWLRRLSGAGAGNHDRLEQTLTLALDAFDRVEGDYFTANNRSASTDRSKTYVADLDGILAELPPSLKKQMHLLVAQVASETDATWLKHALEQMSARADRVPPRIRPVFDYIASRVEARLAELEKQS